MLFQKNILPVENKTKTFDENYINDVSDGSVYQNFRTAIESSVMDFQNVYSFSFNTDGISLADKSTLSIWPFFLNINEISLSERYHIDNTIICGIYISLFVYIFILIFNNIL